MQEVKRVSKRDFENVIEDKQTEGFKLDNSTGTQATLIRRDLGKAVPHIIIFILTFWFSFGLGNLVYLAYRYFAKYDKVIVKIRK